MVTNFSFQKNGLSVSFRDLSTGVPDGSTYHWDFAILKGPKREILPMNMKALGFT